MRYVLTPHPAHPSAVAGVEVEAARPAPGLLTLSYRVADPAGALVLPPRTAAARTDGLWRRTCFEAFVRVPGSQAYYELNLSPSTAWAAYRFDGYRAGMAPSEHVEAPSIEGGAIEAATIEAGPGAGGFGLRASVDLSRLADLPADGPWRLGLCAVIEDGAGTSYWALAHPPGAADFHQAAGFATELLPG